jgi:hypothetical protein
VQMIETRDAHEAKRCRRTQYSGLAAIIHGNLNCETQMAGDKLTSCITIALSDAVCDIWARSHGVQKTQATAANAIASAWRSGVRSPIKLTNLAIRAVEQKEILYREDG